MEQEKSSSKTALEELFQCPICFEAFTDSMPAKVLKFCGHYFCLKCLQQLYAKTSLRGMIRCPLCNYRTVFLTHGLFGRKKVPKPAELGKILPECRVLKVLFKAIPNFSLATTPALSLKFAKRQVAEVFPKLLKCRICRNKLSNPRMLPYCQHSFCLACIQRLYQKQNEGGPTSFLSCPVCHNRIAFVSSLKNKGKDTKGKWKGAGENKAPPPDSDLIGHLLPVDYALSTLMALF